ncbi:MAG: hypothetical protein ACWGQW_04495 [bacterium]
MSKSLVYVVKIDFKEDTELTNDIIGDQAIRLLPMWGLEDDRIQEITVMHNGKVIVGNSDAEV